MEKVRRNIKRSNQAKLARLVIVAELYHKRWSEPKIRREVMARLDLSTYALSTVRSDIATLLQNWRDSEIKDVDDRVTRELACIDATCAELWEQWEKSKCDRNDVTTKKKGSPKRGAKSAEDEGGGVQIDSLEESKKNVFGLGNPAYIAEIRAQEAERRKLLGLYKPEEKSLSGGLTFSSLLVESGVIDDAK